MRALRRPGGLLLAVVWLVLSMGLNLWGGFAPFESLRFAWFDAYQRLWPRTRDASPVIIVAVDEKSLANLGQWPWPRVLVANLLNKIAAAGPVAIGVDLLWPEPDRLSPEIWALSQPNLPADLQQALQALPSHDALLATAIKTLPVALGVAGVGTHSASGPSGPRTLVRVQGGSVLPFIDHYPFALRSLSVMDRAAAGHGLVSVNKDSDGLVRRLPLVAAIGTDVMPSLGVEVVRLVKGARRLDLVVDEGGMRSVHIDDLAIPTTPSGSFWLHYTPHDPARFVSASDVLSGSADEILNGRMVLLGVTGLGLVDHPVTSLHDTMPGVEVHAQFLENIFAGRWLQRPRWAIWAETALLGGVGLLLLVSVPFLAPIWSLLGFLTLATLCLGVGWWAYLGPLWLLDGATPAVGGSMVYMVLLGGSLAQARQQKRALAKIMEQERLATAQMAIELEAAQRIKASEERVRLLLESVGEGVVGVDLHGRITFANPQAVVLLGWTLDSLIGQNVHERFRRHHADGTPLPWATDWWHKTVVDGEACHIEDEVVCRGDATFMDVEFRSTPVRSGEQLVGAVVSFSDITERKRIQHERDEALHVVSSSIGYASRIQRSVLPDVRIFARTFSDYFVFWEPRDQVGGDVYGCDTWGEGILLILGDCTGHGVPGAFMTLIAVGALRQAKSDIPVGDVAALMERMHQLMQMTLSQNTADGEADDGIELGVCYIHAHLNKMLYVGARFDLFVVKDGAVTEVKGNKKGIGYRGVATAQKFDTHEIGLLPTASYYLTTDGLIDQVGGASRRMFGKNRFREQLLSIQTLPMREQQDRIRQALLAHQGDEKRRDDVSIIGFKMG